MLTYYAYLAWLIFALLLCALLYHWPSVGAVWLAIVVLRVLQFLRLGSRNPSSMCTRVVRDEEAPLPLAVEVPCASSSGCEGGGGGGSDGGGGVSTTPSVDRCGGGGYGGGGSHSAAAAAAGSGAEPACEGGLGRVLLVGNGPSIRERGLGSVIDSFDTVVRFNSFVTKGLEEHAGSQTSLWCHMMQWYHISTVEIAQKAAWLPTCYAWNHVVLAPLVFVPNYLMPMMPPPSSITWSVQTYWRAHRALGLRLHQVPTTGFLMLTRLLESVDKVHIVGFDGFGTGRELHYYKERKMQVRVNAAGALLHDWCKEQAAIKRLIDEGRIALL